MKKIGVLLILLVIIPICFAQSKIVVENVTESEVIQEAAALVQSGSDASEKNYVYGNGLVVSLEGDEVNYYHQDIIGSNNIITDGNSEVVYESDYLPFGLVFNQVGENDYGFSNKELDATKLNYFVARYYDSKLGRFLETDPIMDSHAYAYVSNNPKKFIDPTGKTIKPVFSGVSEGVADIKSLMVTKWMNDLVGQKAFNYDTNTKTIELSLEEFSGTEDQTLLYNIFSDLIQNEETVSISYKHLPEFTSSGDNQRFNNIFLTVGHKGEASPLGKNTEMIEFHDPRTDLAHEVAHQKEKLSKGLLSSTFGRYEKEEYSVNAENAARRILDYKERYYYSLELEWGGKYFLGYTPKEYDQIYDFGREIGFIKRFFYQDLGDKYSTLDGYNFNRVEEEN